MCETTCATESLNLDLLMVHVLFRHGERNASTEQGLTYPTDPYKTFSVFPEAKADLTKEGKRQTFHLGQFIRKRYHSFLGPYWTPDIVEVRSTDFIRTRKSALMVLAGLFPPNEETIWSDKLLWQPIPVDYKKLEDDDLLFPDLSPCKLEMMENLRTSNKEMKKKFSEQHRDLMDYIRKNTGKDIKDPIDLHTMYTILTFQKDARLPLPDWTKEVYPQPLEEIAPWAYRYLNFDAETKTTVSGNFLQKVINDFNSKLKGTDPVENKKLVLYCAHDINLGCLLDVLGTSLTHVPQYASAIFIELYKDLERNKSLIKVLYKKEMDGEKLEFISLTDDVGSCTLSSFEQKVKDVLPNKPISATAKPKKWSLSKIKGFIR